MLIVKKEVPVITAFSGNPNNISNIDFKSFLWLSG